MVDDVLSGRRVPGIEAIFLANTGGGENRLHVISCFQGRFTVPGQPMRTLYDALLSCNSGSTAISAAWLEAAHLSAAHPCYGGTGNPASGFMVSGSITLYPTQPRHTRYPGKDRRLFVLNGPILMKRRLEPRAPIQYNCVTVHCL
jgi:hypothetical protein